MNEMVGRLTDVLARQDLCGHAVPYADRAREIIEAMRRPTTEMLDAAYAAKKKHNEEWPGGTENEPCALDPSGEDYWHAMIDAVLRE